MFDKKAHVRTLHNCSSCSCPQRWHELCHRVKTVRWSKIDIKDGVTVARCKFGRSSRGHAVFKIEGVLSADPSTVYQFLQLSTREGGKVSGVEEEGGVEGGCGCDRVDGGRVEGVGMREGGKVREEWRE